MGNMSDLVRTNVPTKSCELLMNFVTTMELNSMLNNEVKEILGGAVC